MYCGLKTGDGGGKESGKREKDAFVKCVSASLPDNAQCDDDGDSLKCLAISILLGYMENSLKQCGGEKKHSRWKLECDWDTLPRMGNCRLVSLCTSFSKSESSISSIKVHF